MIYTINVCKFIEFTHRLKKDGIFKKIEEPKLIYDDDMVFRSYEEIDNWKRNNPIVEVDGIKIETNPLGVGLADPYIQTRTHRTDKPKRKYFEKDDVKRALENGDDSINNVLVVDFDGYVHLLPFEQGKRGYAVRMESFHAGNGYVGLQSSLNHLDHTYLLLLEGWLLHLQTHNEVYRDYFSGKMSEEELKSEIEKEIESMVFN